MGLLCIVTNAEGLSENVLNEETGWVIPKRSPEKIAEIVYHILKQNKIYLDGIRLNAESRVKKEFNLKSQGKLFREFYN